MKKKYNNKEQNQYLIMENILQDISLSNQYLNGGVAGPNDGDEKKKKVIDE